MAEFRGSARSQRRDRSAAGIIVRRHDGTQKTQKTQKTPKTPKTPKDVEDAEDVEPSGSSQRTTAIDLTRTRNAVPSTRVVLEPSGEVRCSAASASSACSAFRRAASPPCEWLRLRCARLQAIRRIVRRTQIWRRARSSLLSTSQTHSTRFSRHGCLDH